MKVVLGSVIHFKNDFPSMEKGTSPLVRIIVYYIRFLQLQYQIICRESIQTGFLCYFL